MPHAARLLTLALVLGTTGWGSCSRRPDPPPLVVEVPVRQYVEVPAELTKPCAIATGPLAEVVKVARLRRESLEECSGRLLQIRKLSDQAVESNRK